EGFTVPVGYHTNLEETIFSRIAETELKQAVQTDGFALPIDYHADLGEAIFVRIAEEKLKATAPTTDFDVPPHYFETLSDKIIGAIQAPNEEWEATPIRRLGRPKKWYSRYAVAASFTAMLGVGGYWGYQY